MIPGGFSKFTLLAETMARFHTTRLDPQDPLIAGSHLACCLARRLARCLVIPDMRANTLGLVERAEAVR